MPLHSSGKRITIGARSYTPISCKTSSFAPKPKSASGVVRQKCESSDDPIQPPFEQIALSGSGKAGYAECQFFDGGSTDGARYVMDPYPLLDTMVRGSLCHFGNDIGIQQKLDAQSQVTSRLDVLSRRFSKSPSSAKPLLPFIASVRH